MIIDCMKGLISFIYPAICEICDTKINLQNTNNNTVCAECLNKIIPFTPVDYLKLKDIKVWSACSYEGVTRECIHLFKYKSKLDLVNPLSSIMLKFANNYLKTDNFDIIIPVPLHSSRFRERGFNQAELIARKLAKGLNLPAHSNIIKRVKLTQAQAGLTKTQRLANLNNAFKVKNGLPVEDKNVLLIDDVFTTGSTINECAKALLNAGAKSIEALVLARGI